MFGNNSKPAKLTRLEIISILNAIIDLYLDAPLKTPPKAPLDTNKLPPRVVPPKTQVATAVPVAGAPRVPRVPRVPREPVKLVLPENKRRGDALLDVLDTLRTYVKYGLFDRDALRREIVYLKQMIEELGGKL